MPDSDPTLAPSIWGIARQGSNIIAPRAVASSASMTKPTTQAESITAAKSEYHRMLDEWANQGSNPSNQQRTRIITTIYNTLRSEACVSKYITDSGLMSRGRYPYGFTMTLESHGNTRGMGTFTFHTVVYDDDQTTSVLSPPVRMTLLASRSVDQYIMVG
jgi:hypothetical protein